jgi:hypothetical protein
MVGSPQFMDVLFAAKIGEPAASANAQMLEATLSWNSRNRK